MWTRRWGNELLDGCGKFNNLHGIQFETGKCLSLSLAEKASAMYRSQKLHKKCK